LDFRLIDLEYNCKSIERSRKRIVERRVLFSLPNVPVVRSGETPAEFVTVLKLLRDADKSGDWPETSVARSRVIAGSQAANGTAASGSFSVGKTVQGSIPRGNVFVDLVQAVFDLERSTGKTFPSMYYDNIIFNNFAHS